ncbi:hypothetical protein IVB22_24670 [Bradyrhizobium sp. 190]|uniref:hypothetical protein n=1 Tax=Bradyrhizobium sp. 190 TaxID=2782658 RepID=UPI001FFB6DEA|nr:hypothetical protein [Bradyrhizobium sp. 190]MCK1515689.1 hypothetical protein [Bradyrhizobium sp. 190]
MAVLTALDPSGVGRTGFRNYDTNGHKHEVVKVAVMRCRFSLPACLTLLCSLLALGLTTAEAAGIGVHMRIDAQNIPRAIAGGLNPHVSVGAGAQAP